MNGAGTLFLLGTLSNAEFLLVLPVGALGELASQIRTTALSDNLLPEGCGQHPKNGALHEQKTPSQPLA